MGPAAEGRSLQAAPSSTRIWAARAIAVAADAVQIVLVPAFFGGAVSPVNDGLDVAVGVALALLVGWHVAFLPTFIAELVPVLNIFPTWTTAVLFVTRAGTNPKQQGGSLR